MTPRPRSAPEAADRRSRPAVGIIMGSTSDRPVLDAAAEILTQLEIPHEVRIVSAHRTPDWMFEYAASAERRGIKVIIAGAGGAAHLPGMTASKTVLPVIGVPVPSEHLKGMDSLLSIVQMPGGVPVATVAIGRAGAINAALLAARILGISDGETRERVRGHQQAQTATVRAADQAASSSRSRKRR
jgi:5-(carboxyamino)imidazole ribonucleotide mutase